MHEVAEKLTCQKLKLRKDQFKLTPSATGKFSTTFFIETASDMDDYVIRIAPPDDLLQLFYEYQMMRQEPVLHRLIQKKTDIPVPPILAYDFSRSEIDRDYLIMKRMPGAPLSEIQYRFNQGQVNQVLRDLGYYVAKLHTITANKYGYIGAHHPMKAQSNWHNAFSIMWLKMLTDCLNCGIYTNDDVKRGQKLWLNYHNVFKHNCNASLCHMDLWAQNVLVNEEGNLTCLFDFDRACFGDVENEFAVAEYCGLTAGAFWEGYGSNPKITREWAIRRWFYLLYEHQKYIVISVSARRNDYARAQRYANQCRAAMEQFAKTGRPEF